MGIIRGVARAARVASKVNKVRKQVKEAGGAQEAVAQEIGKGARKIVRSGLPFATGIIVDKIAGQKIEDFATKKANQGMGQVRGAVQGRLNEFTGGKDSASSSDPWADWDSPSTPPAQPKKDEWDF